MWKKRHLKKRLVLYVVVVVIAIAVSPRLIRRHVLYQPTHSLSETLLQELQFYRFSPLTEYDDSTPFRGFIHVPDAPKMLVMIFHGNAGLAADRIAIARGFLPQRAVILLAEYPGYGLRKGRPSEKQIYRAALDDARFLQKNFPDVPLVVVGESLGSGVATWLATQVKLDGLILVSPFTSLSDLARDHFAGLPVGWIVPDKFDSRIHLAAISNGTNKLPLLIIHGTEDQVVPFNQGESLWNDYSGPKELIPLKKFGHNDLPWNDPQNEIWTGIETFLKKLP